MASARLAFQREANKKSLSTRLFLIYTKIIFHRHA